MWTDTETIKRLQKDNEELRKQNADLQFELSEQQIGAVNAAEWVKKAKALLKGARRYVEFVRGVFPPGFNSKPVEFREAIDNLIGTGDDIEDWRELMQEGEADSEEG